MRRRRPWSGRLNRSPKLSPHIGRRIKLPSGELGVLMSWLGGDRFRARMDDGRIIIVTFKPKAGTKPKTPKAPRRRPQPVGSSGRPYIDDVDDLVAPGLFDAEIEINEPEPVADLRDALPQRFAGV